MTRPHFILFIYAWYLIVSETQLKMKVEKLFKRRGLPTSPVFDSATSCRNETKLMFLRIRTKKLNYQIQWPKQCYINQTIYSAPINRPFAPSCILSPCYIFCSPQLLLLGNHFFNISHLCLFSDPCYLFPSLGVIPSIALSIDLWMFLSSFPGNFHTRTS